MAVNFQTSLKGIAFCDSPQYVVIEDTELSSQISIGIFVWQGLKANVPTTAQRVLLQSGLVDNGSGVTQATFEVFNYISEFVENDTTVGNTNRRGINPDVHVPTTYGVPQYNTVNGTWFQIQASSNGTQPEPTINPTKFATLGTGRYVDNINPGTTVVEENGLIFGHQSPTLVADVARDYIIPVYVGDTSNNDTLQTSAGNKLLATDLGFTLNSTDSAFQIAYVVLSTLDWNWIIGTDFYYGISNSAVVAALTVPIEGLYFNGTTSFLQLQNTKAINVVNDYIEIKWRGIDWVLNTKFPYGYSDLSGGFTLRGDSVGYNPVNARAQTTGVGNNFDASTFATDLSTYKYEWAAATSISLTVDINPPLVFANSIMYPTAPTGFNFGSFNDVGTPNGFSEIVLVYADFNGDVFDVNNNWGRDIAGTTEADLIKVVSYDNGATWQRAGQQIYKFKLQCHAGRPKSYKYLNLHGSISDFPINGSDFDTVSTDKTTFNNLQVNPATGGYDTSAHVTKTFFVENRWTIELDTGWIFEDTPRMVSEMLTSKLGWFEVLEDGEYQFNPANILNSSIRFIRRLYQKQIGYKLNIEIARPLLNKVL